MELYDEDDLKKEKKGKKIIVSLLVISIILLIILGIILVTLPRQTQQQRKSINLDGKEVIISEDLFYTGNDGQAYVSISDFAKLIGYEYYRGEYPPLYSQQPFYKVHSYTFFHPFFLFPAAFCPLFGTRDRV